MSKCTSYYCDFCGKEIIGNDLCGIQWCGQADNGHNLYEDSKIFIVKVLMHNDESNTHMCYDCRQKLIKGVTKDESNIKNSRT